MVLISTIIVIFTVLSFCIIQYLSNTVNTVIIALEIMRIVRITIVVVMLRVVRDFLGSWLRRA